MKMRLGFFILLFLLLAGSAQADQVILKNGDKISGKIADTEVDPVVVETETIGVITIAKEHVLSITTTLQAEARAAEERRLQARWKGEVSAGYSKHTGNTEDSRAHASFDLKRDIELNAFHLKGRTLYGSQDKKMNAQSHYGMGRFEHDVSETSPWLYFGQVEADSDRFANIDWRLVPSAGVGFRFFDTPGFKLRTEIGLGYTHTEYRQTGDEPTNEVTLVPRLYAEKKLWGRATISQDLKVYPSLSDTEQYRLVSDTKLDAPLNDRVALRFQILDQFNSLPGGDKHRNDLDLISAIVYKI